MTALPEIPFNPELDLKLVRVVYPTSAVPQQPGSSEGVQDDRRDSRAG